MDRYCLHALGFSIALGATIVACSDDATPSGAAPANDGGATTSDGSITPVGEGGAPPAVEPTCEPLTGAPTWTFKSPAIAEWTGNPEQDIFGPKILGVSGIAYGNAMWVLMANSSRKDSITWATSTDGTTWTPHTQALPGIKLLNARRVIYDGKRFVFIGVHDQVGTFAYASTDGLTWTSNKVSDAGENVGELVSSGDTAVFVGSNGTMFSSRDLVTWTPRLPAGGKGFGYLDLAFGGGHFVTTANAGVGPFTSPDGENWTKIDAIPQNLSFGRGAFHARTGGTFKKSTDGTTWTPETLSGTGIGVTDGGKAYFGGGRFIIHQVDFGMATSKFGMSLDGAVWSEFGEEKTGLSLKASRGVFPLEVAYGGCHYIAIGNSNMADATTIPYLIVATAPPAP